MKAELTIAYITSREQSMFKEWFVPSLLRQYKGQVKLEVILVDYFQSERRYRPSLFPKTIQFSHISPLPSPFQGRYQKSINTYFDVSSARNSALVHCNSNYISMVDDLVCLSDTWLSSVVEGIELGVCKLGVYEKCRDMEVEDGVIKNKMSFEDGKDARLKHVSKDVTKCHGGWFYGCSASFPLQNALQVNGFDELCTPIGLEDVQMGIRLERTDLDMFLDKRMFTFESSELHYQGKPMLRIDPDVQKERYMAVLKEFGFDKSSFSSVPRFDASHMILDLTELSQSPLALGNRFDLFELRDKVKAGKQITEKEMNFAETWWVNDELIEKM